MIQKFSPDEPPVQEERGWGQEEPEVVTHDETQPLLVLDIGCGKGGDLGKWQQAPQAVGLYVGLDPAEQSVAQARDRYIGMRRGRRPIFDARFVAKDCFGEWIGDVPIVQEVGIDGSVGPGGNMMAARWGKTGGFDVVTMMFTMHYSFENEQKARMMLKNVAGSLKKGGRLIGVCPNSDIISSRVAAWHQKRKDEKVQSGENGDATHASNGSSNTPPPAEEGEVEEDADDSAPSPRWGNSLYNVKFTGVTPPDGVFRPATGWKYTYWMEEAVDVPEYVVPWEAFRALAEDYNLEQRYRKSFLDIWESDNNDPILGPLAVRMGVRKFEGGPLNISDEEREAVGFYHAFCFTKV
ncbi:putative mrna cap methyltransferase [Phaeomoniella chlamydospora]|uniref:mRNA cap guanine-N(7) methyltransferase n=1 Tax=Phaeomoniella chlamydospora TaxID=158046 RepID=A0A0G2EC09_PHACM|nr:putative mrna cap methyltransferase [Phaeomoniella chlamydospora]